MNDTSSQPCQLRIDWHLNLAERLLAHHCSQPLRDPHRAARPALTVADDIHRLILRPDAHLARQNSADLPAHGRNRDAVNLSVAEQGDKAVEHGTASRQACGEEPPDRSEIARAQRNLLRRERLVLGADDGILTLSTALLQPLVEAHHDSRDGLCAAQRVLAARNVERVCHGPHRPAARAAPPRRQGYPCTSSLACAARALL